MQRFRSVSSRYGLYAAAVLGLLMIVLAALLVRGALAAGTASGEAADRAEAVGQAAEAVLGSVRDAETGERGYLLTGRALYLEAYEDGRASLPAHLDRLDGLTEYDPALHAEARYIRELAERRVALLVEAVDLRREEGLPAALEVVQSDRGKQTMDDLRAVTRDLQEETQATTEVESRRTDAAVDRAVLLLVSTGLVLLGLIGAMVVLTVQRGRSAHRQAVMEAERTRLSDQLAHLSTRDSLTGLPNMRLLQDRIEQALVRAEREHTLTVAVFVDLDRFQHVNDSAGRSAGDELLTQVAERLPRLIRSSDTVARIGADQFVVLCEQVATVEEAHATAERLRVAVSEASVDAGPAGHVSTTASVGVAVADHRGIQSGAGERVEATPGLLVAASETAMIQAKENGRDRTNHYDASGARRRTSRHQLQADLRAAVAADDGFWVAYQPLVALNTSEVIGFEALLRWDHPTRGPVSPADFIPLAEESGDILALGERVLRQACRQGAQWNRQRAERDLPTLKVSINVSARQLLVPRFSQTVEAVLGSTGLGASHLALEITETVLVDGAHGVMRQLHHLASLGITLSLDDFGTGYSSLSYLQRFPIGLIKVDRSFVSGLGRVKADNAIVRAVVALGHNLDRPVLAEGIETEDQARRLREMGCDFGQGYLYGRPARADSFDSLIVQPQQAWQRRRAV